MAWPRRKIFLLVISLMKNMERKHPTSPLAPSNKPADETGTKYFYPFVVFISVNITSANALKTFTCVN